MPGTEPNTDEPDASVVSIGDAPSRRRLRYGSTSEGSPREDIDRSGFDTGYEYTLDLADTAVNLPEEELNPDVDGILRSYKASQAEASVVPSPETVDDPNTDEILTAISTHHGKSQSRGPRPAPRGSADLSPAAPRIKRRISLTSPPLRLRTRTRARTALAAHEAIGAPAVSASRRSHPRRFRIVVVVLPVAAAVALAAIVVSLSGRSAKLPSSTTASRASAVQPSLIGTTTGKGLLFHFLSRREFPWGAPPLVPKKAKSRAPAKTGTRRTKAQAESSHAFPAGLTQRDPGSAPTSSSHTTTTSPSHTTTTSSSHTTTTSPSHTTTTSSSHTTTTNSTHTTPATTTRSSQSSSSRTSATGSSAGCQAAGVMAPTSCGKPSL
jgi:hypothetical protein